MFFWDASEGWTTALLTKILANVHVKINNFILKFEDLDSGVELSINHVRGISEGFVFAKAIPIHMGRTMQLWKISIKDENNRLKFKN